MATLAAYGVTVDAPPGWDGRITRRAVDEPTLAVRTFATASRRDLRESTHAVVHLANFALPETRGDFGSGAVEIMAASHVLAVLLEYHPDAARTTMFATRGAPERLDLGAFSGNGLQHALPGQGGAQWFFQESGRAWCLYVVLGNLGGRATLVPMVESALARVRIEAA